MLANLQNVPMTPEDWRAWLWSHRASHDKIRAAVAASKGANLPSYALEPVEPSGFDLFFQNNQNAHTEMNDVLGLQTSDMLAVDTTNTESFTRWIQDHYQEHFDAETALGI